MQNLPIESSTLWELVAQRAKRTPDAHMLIEADCRIITFGQFAREVERVAAGLHRLGIGPGTEVTWQLPTSSPAIVLSVALARLGARQNPVIHLYGRKEVSAILTQNQSSFYIVPARAPGERDYVELIESVCASLASPPVLIVFDASFAADDTSALPAAPVDGATPRWVYYTSGTTSEPKGVLHSDLTLMAAGQLYADLLGVGPSDVGTIAFPFAHVGGLMNLVMLLARGMSAVLLPRFSAEEAVRIYRRYGVTLTTGSTAHYLAYLGEQRKQPDVPVVPTLKVMSGGGAAKPPELYFEARRELNCTIAHCYGMTEAPMIAGGSPRHNDDQLAYSDGQPVAGMEIRIVRADETLAGFGESGEIRVKGSTVCKGYTDPRLNADAFDADGFFRTGDLGVRCADGHIALTGRLKDVIIRKGENVSAREIEDILYQHPKVAGAAVIGLPDKERGERVCAVIELRDSNAPLQFGEMLEFFEAAGMMRQKIPEQLEIVESLPRNETFNKVLKFKLRDMFSKAGQAEESHREK